MKLVGLTVTVAVALLETQKSEQEAQSKHIASKGSRRAISATRRNQVMSSSKKDHCIAFD
jgi:hypothetical protein